MITGNIKAGDHKQFETLFKEWYIPMTRYAYSIMQDEEEAEDVVQRVFCRLWDKNTDIEIHTSIKSFFLRIVHNDCINKIRLKKIRSEHIKNISYDTQGFICEADKLVVENEFEEKVAITLSKMTPKCRKAFELSRFQQLSYKEIAKEMNITISTVETHIVNALKLFREELKDYLVIFVLLIINLF